MDPLSVVEAFYSTGSDSDIEILEIYSVKSESKPEIKKPDFRSFNFKEPSRMVSGTGGKKPFPKRKRKESLHLTDTDESDDALECGGVPRGVKPIAKRKPKRRKIKSRRPRWNESDTETGEVSSSSSFDGDSDDDDEDLVRLGQKPRPCTACRQMLGHKNKKPLAVLCAACSNAFHACAGLPTKEAKKRRNRSGWQCSECLYGVAPAVHNDCPAHFGTLCRWSEACPEHVRQTEENVFMTSNAAYVISMEEAFGFLCQAKAGRITPHISPPECFSEGLIYVYRASLPSQSSDGWKHWTDDNLRFKHVSTRLADKDDVRVVIKIEKAETGLRRRVIWTNADHYLFVVQYYSEETESPFLEEGPVEDDDGKDDDGNDGEPCPDAIIIKDEMEKHTSVLNDQFIPIFQESPKNDEKHSSMLFFMSALGLIPKTELLGISAEGARALPLA